MTSLNDIKKDWFIGNFYEDYEPNGEKICDYFLSRFKSMLDGVWQAIDEKSVEEVHAADCEFQRKGCDCGYVDRVAYNEGIETAKKIINSLLE